MGSGRVVNRVVGRRARTASRDGLDGLSGKVRQSQYLVAVRIAIAVPIAVPGSFSSVDCRRLSYFSVHPDAPSCKRVLRQTARFYAVMRDIGFSLAHDAIATPLQDFGSRFDANGICFALSTSAEARKTDFGLGINWRGGHGAVVGARASRKPQSANQA
jgi:hypothetical protein